MSDMHHRLRTLLFLVPYVYRNRGVKLSELAQRLGVEQDALFREIDFLLMVGRPPFSPDDLIDIHVDGGRVFVELPSSLQHPPRFTAFEALALACAAQLFTGDAQMGEAATAVRLALDKVLASLPAETRGMFDELADRYLVLSQGGASPQLDTLRRAVEQQIEVEMGYYAAGRDAMTERTVRPHGLAYRGGVWYLVAWCTEREARRIFRVSRILDARLTDRIFDPPADFDAGAWLDEHLGLPSRGEREVVLRFAAADARWVAERWADAYCEPLADGGLRVRFYDVADEYVLAVVASFGGRAAIEQPTELARKLARQAGQALQNYEQ